MVNLLSYLAILTGGLFFSVRRAKRYLRFLQQQDYNNHRYLQWVRERNAFDQRGLVIVGIGGILLFFSEESRSIFTLLICVLIAAGLGVATLLEEDPLQAGKLRLNMTERASRILRTWLGLYALLLALLLFLLPQLSLFVLFHALLFRFTPHLVAAANRLLDPVETRIQKHFRDDASRLLAEVNPFVIGITGSYGKTGTKAALGEILNVCLAPTFWPPRSFNTIMGITREIRENLKPGTRYAVIEMAAYGRGSIRRLCEFTPPRAAIVTGVGLMHLERFGTEENIYLAKSELAQALPPDGILVVNGDSPGARRMADEYRRQTTLLYGLDPARGGLDCLMKDIRADKSGTQFTLCWQRHEYSGRIKLLGETALSNVAGALTMAFALGCNPLLALAAAANLEPVANRLSTRRVRDGEGEEILFLDDAFNSNPLGFRAALKVFGEMSARRRVLVTPGMVELGPRQSEENRAVAAEASKVADLAFVVSETNREALVSGLRDGGLRPEQIETFPDRDAALKRLTQIQTGGDVVLLENDLPDLYEPNTIF